MKRLARLSALPFLSLLALDSVLAEDPGKRSMALFEACQEAKYSKTAGVSLSGAVLEDLDLSGATLRDLDLTGATLKRVDLSRARLVNVKLTGAQIVDGKMRGAVICESDLARANLRGADLGDARLLQVNLESADLRHSGFYGLALGPWSAGEDDAPQKFQGARLDGAALDAEVLSLLEGTLFDKLTLAFGSPNNEQVFTRSEIDLLRRSDPFSTDPLPNPFVGSLPPSFPCREPLSPAEKEICSESYLAESDLVLAALFRQLEQRLPPARRSELRASQRAWLKQRDACSGAPAELNLCIHGLQKSRIGALLTERGRFSPHEPVTPGYFRWIPTARWIPPREAKIPAELRSKVAKLFDYDSGDAFIWIRKAGKDRILVDGASRGANGHVCILENVWFSPASDGSFVETEPEEGPAWRGDGLPLAITVVEPFLLVTGGGGAYCGARAGWGEIHRRAAPSPSSR